eukprot:gene4353-3167_t
MRRGARSAAKSSAQEILQSKGTPAGLDDFLAGYTADAGASSHKDESVLVMHLKLMAKSSDITKQKSLREINSLLQSLEEPILANYVCNLVNIIVKHSHYPNPVIRAGVYTALHHLMSKGKIVKQAVVPELPGLAGPWLMAMQDGDFSAQQQATSAFQAAFSPEKRTVMLLTYKDNVLSYATQKIEEIVEESSSPTISDTQTDGHINALYTALRAMGYMIKQVSASQAAVMAFLETPVLQKLMPQSGKVSGKGKVVFASPHVRAGVLSLLRDVVTYCPSTPTIHQFVARALEGSIRDLNVFTAKRVWELLLFWCRSGGTSIIGYFPPKFLDAVVDTIMKCRSDELSDIIFPSLFPLLTQLSKDPRCAGVIDEFCGALIEKIHLHIETPTLSNKELSVISSSLMSCWELHTVRAAQAKAGAGSPEESLELFTVIVLNFSELLAALPRHQRHLEAIGGAVAKSLLKTLVRSEGLFTECMRVLCATEDAAFVVFPSSGDPASPTLPSREGYALLQNGTIGRMCNQMVLETTYSRWIEMLSGYFQRIIQDRLDADDAVGAVTLVRLAGNSFCPPVDTIQLIAERMTCIFQKWSAQDSKGNLNMDADTLRAYEDLLTAMLRWKRKCHEADLSSVLSAVEMLKGYPTIQSCVQRYKMQDTGALVSMLITACKGSQFDDIELYLHHMDDAAGISLSKSEQEAILTAARSAIRQEFGTLCTQDGVDIPETDRTSDEGGTDDQASVASESDTGSEVKKEKFLGGKGSAVCGNLMRWITLLHPTQLGAKLTDVQQDFFSVVGEQMLLLLTAVAPCLYPEHYLSIKALRAALEDTDDDMVDAIEGKTHFVTTQQFNEVEEQLRDLLSEYKVETTVIDKWYESFWNRLLEGDGEEEEEEEDPYPAFLLAAHQLQQLVPLASPRFIVAITTSEEVWDAFRVLALESEDIEYLFDGHYGVEHMGISLYPAVRSAQMIRLMEFCLSHSFIPDASSTAVRSDKEAQQRAGRVYLLLRAAMTQELFSSSIIVQLYKLLRMMLVRLTSPAAVSHLVQLITANEAVFCDQLFCTFASVVKVLAGNLDPVEKLSFPGVIRSIVGELTAFMITNIFTPTGAAGITTSRSNYYTIFFQLMDRAADALQTDLLSCVPDATYKLFIDCCCDLTAYDCRTVKMALIVHRHLDAKPEISLGAVKALIQYAQRQSVMDGLEVLSELSCCRVMDQMAFGELVRSILHSMCRCYSLKHLPTNGRLMKLNPQQQANSSTVNFKHLRRVVLAATTARRGVVLHSRLDDVLRGTVNLVIFDAVCECVTHLRDTRKTEVPLLVRLIASTVEFLGGLQPEDVSVLRASEASTHTIASMFVFVYLWLSATTVQKLDAMGTETVAGVMRAACQLAHLTLVRSGISLAAQIEPLLVKLPTKPLRSKFSSAEPMKLRAYRRQNTLLCKTHKHKLALFPYLLGWGSILTNSSLGEYGELISRNNVCTLLDVLVSLMLSSVIPGSTRMEDTYMAAAVAEDEEGSGTTCSPRDASLSALTRTDAAKVMEKLAQGADAVFRLLLQQRTLVIVKDWVDTVEKRVQELVSQFVQRFISKLLVQQALKDVLSHSEDGKTVFTLAENMTVEVSIATSSVGLEYDVEDEQLSVRISFPPEYPLLPPKVEYRNEKEYGVSWRKWRGWMMQMTGKLFGGGANVWDCIVLFQRNVVAHFDGLEPCPICFAIVSAVDNRIPEKTGGPTVVLMCARCVGRLGWLEIARPGMSGRWDGDYIHILFLQHIISVAYKNNKTRTNGALQDFSQRSASSQSKDQVKLFDLPLYQKMAGAKVRPAKRYRIGVTKVSAGQIIGNVHPVSRGVSAAILMLEIVVWAKMRRAIWKFLFARFRCVLGLPTFLCGLLFSVASISFSNMIIICSYCVTDPCRSFSNPLVQTAALRLFLLFTHTKIRCIEVPVNFFYLRFSYSCCAGKRAYYYQIIQLTNPFIINIPTGDVEKLVFNHISSSFCSYFIVLKPACSHLSFPISRRESKKKKEGEDSHSYSFPHNAKRKLSSYRFAFLSVIQKTRNQRFAFFSLWCIIPSALLAVVECCSLPQEDWEVCVLSCVWAGFAIHYQLLLLYLYFFFSFSSFFSGEIISRGCGAGELEEFFPPHGRKLFSRHTNKSGSLNLFSTCHGAAAPPAAAEPVVRLPPRQEPAGLVRAQSQSGRRAHYTNQESTATQEFPCRGLRRVVVPPRAETPHGLKSFHHAAAAQQHVQVVNITSAYKDPTQMGKLRVGVRCSQPNDTAEMKDIMEYRVTPEQLRGETLQIPVGVPITEEGRHAAIRYSTLEKFCQAVRDHCQQRAKGLTQFYVCLCRDMIGHSTSSTPRVGAPPPWSLEAAPETRSLSLLRCRDQLVALTSISVALEDIAILMWGPATLRTESGEVVSEADLGQRAVPYTDFAAAFGGTPNSNNRLAGSVEPYSIQSQIQGEGRSLRLPRLFRGSRCEVEEILVPSLVSFRCRGRENKLCSSAHPHCTVLHINVVEN